MQHPTQRESLLRRSLEWLLFGLTAIVPRLQSFPLEVRLLAPLRVWRPAGLEHSRGSPETPSVPIRDGSARAIRTLAVRQRERLARELSAASQLRLLHPQPGASGLRLRRVCPAAGRTMP